MRIKVMAALFCSWAFACGCSSGTEPAQPVGDVLAVDQDQVQGLGTDGLGDWLHEQCPDGVAIALQDPETGERARFMPCETLREKALANPSVRASLVQTYKAQAQEGEPIGRATEPLTPLGGLACALVALTPGLIFDWPGRGCQNPGTSPEDQRACENAIGGGSVGLGIFCGIAAFF